MEKFRIMATTTFGLEAVAKREITDLGFEDITVSDGYVDVYKRQALDLLKSPFLCGPSRVIWSPV